ncbi:MAG: carboxy terminal-processing peptidase [Melioribacteraceae bacterium]|nr:carboxy terminal-processing peptidase [Melioribacteraceae bacterium]
MKKNLLIILLIINSAFLFGQNPELVLKKDHKIDSTKIIIPDEFYKREEQVIIQLLNFYHYKKQPLNDSLSSQIFDEYLKSLDFNKSYFLKSDIQKFEVFRNNFDDFLREGNLEIPFSIFNLFKKRVNERIEYIKSTLKNEFDFSINETYKPDREKEDWAKDEKELNELWRLRLKNEALGIILTGKDFQKAASDLLKRYQNFHKVILQYEAEDVFSIYINSFLQIIDPHTDYFSPVNSDNFNISMRLSLEGIGAQLRQEGDYTVVASIVPGGPAAKSKLLNEEDKIIGVAQGEDGEMVDVIGWRLDDTIQLIRGKKGTVVRLLILKKEEGDNAIPREIKLTRDQIKLEEQAAKSEILNFDHEGKNFKLGVIKLPSFYTDFEGQRLNKPDYKSTTRDVKNLIEKLKQEKIDGLLIDLRGNGGGSLQEAIQLTGLFIKEGPVVQVRNSNNIIEVNRDPDPSIFYDGPLAVIIDRFSASASEIFSAAIQDYGRGLIIGEKTYGKGTVQNLYDLGMMIRNNERKAGQLKLTQAKFYRINGSSTQRKGVTPDIQFPSQYDEDEFGESSRTSALPWDQINTTEFSKYMDLSKVIPLLSKKHEQRTKKDVEYQLIVEEINENKLARKQKEFSLNIEIRKAQKEEAEAKKKKRDDEKAKLLGIKIEDKKEVDNPNQNSTKSDYQLKESGKILADFILAKVG